MLVYAFCWQLRESFQMRDNPDKKFIVSFAPGSDIEEDLGKFFLRITDMDAVQFQENKHRMCPDPFVPSMKAWLLARPKPSLAAF